MSKFTESEKRYLQSLVRECSLFRLSEREALDYIKSKLGRSIGQAHYYVLKRKLESDETAQDWLTDFARTKFVSEHMKRYGEMDLLLQVGLHMLTEQRAKPLDEQDSSLILSIMSQITKIGERLTSLQGGAPVLAQLSAMLQKKQQQLPPQLQPEEQELISQLAPEVREHLIRNIPYDSDRRLEIARALVAAQNEPDDTTADGNDNEDEEV